MLKAAEKSAQAAAQSLGRAAPLVLGVTVLTSMDGNELSEVGFQAGVASQVERLAALAVQAGLRGLVCSPLEIAALRKIIPREIQLVTPGIRAGTGRPDDQKRTLTAGEAWPRARIGWSLAGPFARPKAPALLPNRSWPLSRQALADRARRFTGRRIR